MGSMNGTESIVLGGGCFWCLEAVFERIEGVKAAVSGYAGGRSNNPSYEQVTTGATGHAEVVKIDFDPERLSLEDVLEVFFSAHDPTTENRQGADVGSQYRSAVYVTDKSQEGAVRKKIASIDAAKTWRNKVVTEVAPLAAFWPAEEYHQDYYEKHPYAGYCRVVIAPKLKKIGLDVDAIVK